MSSSCANDGSLGPVVHGCRDDFDFTVGFEQAALTIVPAAVLILCSLLRLFQLLQKQKIIDETILLCLKIVSKDTTHNCTISNPLSVCSCDLQWPATWPSHSDKSWHVLVVPAGARIRYDEFHCFLSHDPSLIFGACPLTAAVDAARCIPPDHCLV